MYCGNCGNKVNDTDKYCENCGFRINYDFYQERVEQIKVEEVTVYEEPNEKSQIALIASVVIFILSLLPLHLIYTSCMVIISVSAIIATAILYRKRKDKKLVLSIILNCASFYTVLGWIYYLLVI